MALVINIQKLKINTWNLYGWAMSQKIQVNNLDWIEDTSQFKEDFTKKI